MNFAHPVWLPLGFAALLVLLWVWRRHDQRQRLALEQFIAPRLRAGLTQTLSKWRLALKRALFAAAVLLAFAALAEPQAGFRWEKFTQRGSDILFAVDTSRSMSTPDVRPTRLERAKLAIDGFVERLNGDAVGLVAFAGTAFIQTPLTIDYGAFRESLAALDVGIVPRGGTNITSAIQASQQALRARPGSDKILILVTDGEDLEGDSLAAAKAAATQDGLKIYTVGVGSANGDLIPLPQEQGGGFLKDSAGHLVKSHLDEAALKALAAATGGSYAPLGADNGGLETIYQSAIAPLAKHALESRTQRIYTQRFQWPLGAAILLLLASVAVGTRRAPRRAASLADASSTDLGTFAAGRLAGPTLAVLLAAAGLLRAPSAQASPSSATAAYMRGDYAAAAKAYASAAAHTPQEPLLQFDAGAAAYKAGSYEEAAHAFQASVNAAQSGSSKRLGDQEDAFYNLGDSLFRQGEKTVQSNAPQTISAWTDSLKAYDAALELRPDDADGKFNRDVVKRKLDALKKQQQSKDNQAKPKESAQNQSKSGQSKRGQSQRSPSQANSSPNNQSQQNQGQNKGSTMANDAHGPGSQTPQSQQSPQKAVNNLPSPDSSSQPASAQSPVSDSQPTPPGAFDHSGQKSRGGSVTAPGGEVAQNADDQRAPGGMSREEARELLDSVKDAKLPPNVPSVPDALNAANTASRDEPLKDW